MDAKIELEQDQDIINRFMERYDREWRQLGEFNE